MRCFAQAPEVYRHQMANECVDTYSYGIMLWELAARQPLLFNRYRTERGQRCEYTPAKWAADAAKGKRAEFPTAGDARFTPQLKRARARPARKRSRTRTRTAR